jgi:hypothetical protein
MIEIAWAEVETPNARLYGESFWDADVARAPTQVLSEAEPAPTPSPEPAPTP